MDPVDAKHRIHAAVRLGHIQDLAYRAASRAPAAQQHSLEPYAGFFLGLFEQVDKTTRIFE
jgi:hypothetical protein